MTTCGRLLIETITSPDPNLRDRAVRTLVAGIPTAEILQACEEIEAFRQGAENLYERVRASMFLHAIYRYQLQESADLAATGKIPFDGFMDLMERRFEQAIASFRAAARRDGPNGALASALAQAYEQVAFATLADQVRRSVRSCRGNRWMFRVGQADEHPIRLHPRLLERSGGESLFPILVERTPVRLDLSHSGWSDIFFLGMDYPSGARVLNISVDLGVHGRDDQPRPPIETRLRVIPEPILRLTSIDLGDCKDVTTLDELFNFGNDYLGLVKAGVIASGLVPPALEGTASRLDALLARIVRPGLGLELVSKVNDIPKGSRLAVSTNLLASLISLLMRATGQTRNLTGALDPEEARVVVARAILGEWLGGSGGGWQDSGGIFPGVKIIEGVPAGADDPECGISRGRLLPAHELLDGRSGIGADFQERLAQSLVLVHGGMAQNVGPILNMVTSKYLLRSREEWRARQEALTIFEGIVESVKSGEIEALGGLTTRNWDGPLKRIIPWVSNQFTESIIAGAREALGDDFWGFLMLGGMSGGGMAFFVAPKRQAEFRVQIAAIMRRVKARLDDALPFAMDPVVYDFRINPAGTIAALESGDEAMMPSRYYTLQVPRMLTTGTAALSPLRKVDVDHFANNCRDTGELLRVFRTMINNLFPVTRPAAAARAGGWDEAAESIRMAGGFDAVQHEQLRKDLQRGRIGLARNRLPLDTEIRDVADSDLIAAEKIAPTDPAVARGLEALARGEVGVVTLAAGVGSRWTTGAGVVKAVNPFVLIDGRHRSFLELHLAKTRQAQRQAGVAIPHVITTSFLTHAAIERHLAQTRSYGHDGPVYLSRGQSIGQRLIPMARDLTFLWEEGAHETLDENKQKVRDASRRAILEWAKAQGEGTDYTDNLPIQRFNPPGHFYEVPNLLRNGVLAELLERFPNLRRLLVHNIDTLGANLDPGVLGLALASGATLGFEVIPRRIDDRGGGLARVGGRLRLLEGLAQPREDTEFELRYYNSLTTWVDIDGLLSAFQLTRADLKADPAKVASAVRAMAARVPTYVTIKDVKRRWGHGQEDVFPVVQFEKLWGDLSALPDLPCAFLAVDRRRGQQLKDAAQLDGWANDGSSENVTALCDFPPNASGGTWRRMSKSGLVLVTGGAGFIGSHLVEALLEQGCRVRVVDNLSTGHRANLAHLAGQYEWIEGDLADPAVCQRAAAGVEAVFHDAAIPSVPRSVREPLQSHSSGPTATINVLEAARQAGVSRFIFAASSSAYGETEELPKHEAIFPGPLSPYAAGKLAGELYVSVYAQTMGLDGVSLRYFNVFGPRQDPSSPYSGVISRFAEVMRAGRPPVIYGDGHQTRDFTYVSNIVDANLAALRAPSPLRGVVLNVGTGRRISLLDLVAAINKVLGTNLEPQFQPARPGDVRDSQASLDRIKAVLGYEPRIDFDEGLRRTLEAQAVSLVH